MITDGNPHQEGMIDHHRALYLPYSEEKNTVMELPGTQGLFFTSQIICGGELIIAYDRSLHKSWVMSISQVYTPPKVMSADYLTHINKQQTFIVLVSQEQRVERQEGCQVIRGMF